MSEDYIPKNDSELQVWLSMFVTAANANLATFGLVAGDVAPLATAQTGFGSALTAQVAAEGVYHAAVEVKRAKRAAAVAGARALARRVNNHPAMTDAMRASFGLPIPDRTRTRREPKPDVPDVVLETRPGMVIVHFGTSPGNEQHNHKPSWAIGCNIYRRRAGEADFALIAFDTASPYVDATTTGPAADYQYKVSYRGTRPTDEGPLSSSVTVAAGG